MRRADDPCASRRCHGTTGDDASRADATVFGREIGFRTILGIASAGLRCCGSRRLLVGQQKSGILVAGEVFWSASIKIEGDLNVTILAVGVKEQNDVFIRGSGSEVDRRDNLVAPSRG
jgi:hypothetical protein